MSDAKDPFQILADEITLIRHDMRRLQRTSLDKDEAEHLNSVVADSLDRMAHLGSRLEKSIDARLQLATEQTRQATVRAAQSAAEAAVEKSHAKSIEAARSLSQAAGEARRQAWRYFGGFWVWLASMLATGVVLGLLLAYGTETAKSFFSIRQMARYSCDMSWVGGTVVDQDDGSRFCAFWIIPPSEVRD